MKKIIMLLCVLFAASSAVAFELPFNTILFHEVFTKMGGIADWKIGDTLVYNMRIKPVPLTFKAVMKLTQSDREGVTINEEISYSTFKIDIENLIDTETGQIKRIRINGKDQALPSSDGAQSRIVNEEEAHIKVPAGEYDCIHLVTADKEGHETHAWMNPSAVPLSGLLKSSAVQGIATIEMELISFVFGH